MLQSVATWFWFYEYFYIMFAIVDIETCGSKYEYKRGRITEICIALHDGLQVVKKWSTLINPECYISPYFVSLSGITNEMVADAPKFYEVAKKILELTESHIFVAHNVGFDYGFIKDEFNNLGYKFRRDTLCTVRLSRKLMPGKLSYSLGNLCSSLGIEIENRHRAEGDVDGTVQLFNKLLELKAMHPQYKNKGVDELMTRRIDKIKEYILKKLPEDCGVYLFKNKNDEIIYIGKSVNMYNRAISHFNSQIQKSKKMLNDLYNVDYILCGSELVSLLLESELIKKHKPKFNRARKADSFTHCIDYFIDEAGIINFKIVNYDEAERPLRSFVNYSGAREQLDLWIDGHQLCLRYCGLTSDEAVCFNHHIKKCNGICAEQEDIEQYNQRAHKILENIIYPENSFLLVDKGRKEGEFALILIDNGRYEGFGYMYKEESIRCLDDAKGYISNRLVYPDADDIIKGYLKNNRLKKVIF